MSYVNNDLLKHSYDRISYYLKQIKKYEKLLKDEKNDRKTGNIKNKIKDCKEQILKSRIFIASFTNAEKNNKFLN